MKKQTATMKTQLGVRTQVRGGENYSGCVEKCFAVWRPLDDGWEYYKNFKELHKCKCSCGDQGSCNFVQQWN